MVFYELPAFAKFREGYLDDDAFKELQIALMANPEAGAVIEGTAACENFGLQMQVETRVSAEACASFISSSKPMIKSGCLPCTTRMKRPI
jgi:hypothetical protein